MVFTPICEVHFCRQYSGGAKIFLLATNGKCILRGRFQDGSLSAEISIHLKIWALITIARPCNIQNAGCSSRILNYRNRQYGRIEFQFVPLISLKSQS